MQSNKRRRGNDTGAKRGQARTTSSYSNIRTGTRQSQPSRTATQLSRRTLGTSVAPLNVPTRASSNQSELSSHTFRGDDEAPSVVTHVAPDQAAIMDEEALSEVVMALNVTDKGSVGCVYYVARHAKLCFMEDVQAGGSDVVDALKLFIDPTVILVSTKCNDEVIHCLDPELRNQRASVDGRSDQTRLPYLLECRPNSEFNYATGKAKLLSLRIGQLDGPAVTYIVPGDAVATDEHFDGHEAEHSGSQNALLRLSGLINMDSRLTVGCVGAVLTYLQRRKAATFLPGDRDAEAVFPIDTIEMFSLGGSMFINAETLLSLQITSTEAHPNVQQQGPSSKNWSRGSKEGLSVYGLFHHLAKTGQGRRLLRQIFLRPSLNMEVIDERHRMISALLVPENTGVLSRLINALGGVKDMRSVLLDLRKGVSRGVNQGRAIAPSVWTSLRQFTFSALDLTDALGEATGLQRLVIPQKIAERFDKQRLAEVGALISNIVDFDMSREAKRTVVLNGINDELDEAKHTYEAIEDMLSHVAEDIARNVPEDLESKVNVIFFPQIGFLISIEHEEGATPVSYEGPNPEQHWEKMFTSSTHAYYKNSNTMELDDEYGDIWGRILDMEIEIIQNTAQRVLEYEHIINIASDICGELDAIVALTRGAEQYKLTKPDMTEQNVVKIDGGRHILQELTVPAFVPNGTYLLGGCGDEQAEDPRECKISADPRIRRPLPPDAPSMLLLTGPNYSGKSIYLKQVAIIVYLAHIGSFVPARYSTIGLTDAILTRVSTRETVSRIQSACMIDLQQASIALAIATRRSLLIIDEFGKGTECDDGAGLAAGVFEHLLQRGAHCPKVLGATHFHEIFESGFLPSRPALGFSHMEVEVHDEQSEAENRITYLYNLRSGRSSSSYGTLCAAMNGIEAPVTERADKLIELAARGEDLVEACAQLPAAEMAELAVAEETAREFLMHEAFDDPRRILDDLLSLQVSIETTTETRDASCSLSNA
ncbi:Putative DNA mismatch repair protein MutS, core [Septoria linicola]|uniref:DNA mismatch repair protein MSH5 n=1 Tax=Septoria linicola TaxID=215465 RepID=A0A9Q9AIS8_9PEZI|nr:Putative DNA mismatch repair protein MutS, core [Septoria linicola]